MYVRTEYVAPDVIPVQYGIGRIAQPFPGYGEIVKVLQVSLYRLPHEIGSATVELLAAASNSPTRSSGNRAVIWWLTARYSLQKAYQIGSPV